VARTERSRLDELLLARGLADTRSVARGLILAGRVIVDGVPSDKAGTLVRADAQLVIKQTRRFASRAGEKLAHALEAFALSVAGRDALDVGASTGGFVDCLLQNGARRVIALDVGHGQLDMRLRSDQRVVALERLNARYLQPHDLPYIPDFLTMDVSFISVSKVLPAVSRCMAAAFEAVVLVKPQFEAGPALVGKGGVVRDPEVHRKVLVDLGRFVIRDLGLELSGLCRSGLPGADGNHEFFMYALRGREKGLTLDRLESAVSEILAGAEEGGEAAQMDGTHEH
jgi:23S rRNA (cytidine1920-2'-O)/16S rRNA (cytidine1409-2'-O)-methyltransferase